MKQQHALLVFSHDELEADLHDKNEQIKLLETKVIKLEFKKKMFSSNNHQKS